MSTESPMIRLAPVPFEELPHHPSFGDTNAKRPDLLHFALTLLDQGRSFLLPTHFNLHFKSHSWKPSPPSNNEVEVLSTSVPASALQSLPWNSDQLPRSAPASFEDEFWYARRSYHHNLSVKHNSPGTASWQEFVYGLRDQHSKHEYDFTPTIYDAHLVVEWNEALNAALASVTRTEADASRPRYSHATMAIYEMCHKLPNIVGPRCFPVLVITANVSSDEFIAVTVPVNIRNFPGAFYSNGRNRKEGLDSQMKKSVTLGEYCAVERVIKYLAHDSSRSKTGELKGGKDGADAVSAAKTHTHSRGEDGEEVEWVMATASHTRGNLPMVLQRMGVPGSIAKDVGLFLKWIRKVPDDEIRSQKVETSTARPTSKQ